MKYLNSENEYGFITKLFHGLVTVLISAQFITALSFEYLDKSFFPIMMMYHKSFGLTLLFIAILFFILRMCTQKPVWPSTMHKHEKILAWCVHTLLYLLLILMPLSGWIMSTAAGYIPRYFGLFPVPFPGLGLNQPLAAFCGEVHEISAWIIFSLILIHILGALKHHFFDKNNILRRMFW